MGADVSPCYPGVKLGLHPGVTRLSQGYTETNNSSHSHTVTQFIVASEPNVHDWRKLGGVGRTQLDVLKKVHTQQKEGSEPRNPFQYGQKIKLELYISILLRL